MKKMGNNNLMYFHGKTIDGARFTISGKIDNDDILVGVSICSDKDNFNKSIGRTISTGRVLNQKSGGRGKCRVSLYSGEVGKEYEQACGYPIEYFKGIEIKLFIKYAMNFTHFTKKELLQEFRLYSHHRGYPF